MNRRFGANGEASFDTFVSTRTRVPYSADYYFYKDFDGG